MKIFTKRFFQLSRSDQRAIVDSVIHDLELAHFADRKGQRKAAEMVERITTRAIKHGVYAAENEGKE